MKLFKLSLLAILLMFPFTLMAQDPEYKKWESHDVKGLYIEIENENDADFEEDGRYFQRTKRLSRGEYEVEVNVQKYGKSKEPNSIYCFVSIPFSINLTKEY